MSKKILKTRAFVIQKYHFQESSFVCHCFSEDLGKVKFILRGATKKQSKLSNYQLGSIVVLDTSYQQKGEWLKTFQNHSILEIIPDDYESFCFLSFVLEFVFRSCFEVNHSTQIFLAYQNFYQQIKDQENRFFAFLRIFATLIQIVGFYIRFEKCLVCQKTTYKKQNEQVIFRKENYKLSVSQSGFICSHCQKEKNSKENFFTAAHIKIFFYFNKGVNKSLAVNKISANLIRECLRVLFECYALYYPLQNFQSSPPIYRVLELENLDCFR